MQLVKPRYIYTATLLWWIAIWVVSSTPSNKLPSVRILGWDKLGHTLVYFVLALLINRSLLLLRIRKNQAALLYSIVLLTAAMDEYHQVFIPGRSVSVWDFVANSVGLLAGFGVFWISYDRSR